MADPSIDLSGAPTPEEILAAQQANSTAGLYIGIPRGSQTETRLSGLGVAATPWQSLVGVPGPSPGDVPFRPPFSAYKTNSELDQLSSFGPDDIYALQQRLNMAGMLDGFVPGKIDTATRKAFVELLGISNSSQQSWQDTLDWVSSVGGKASKGRTRAPLTIQYTNPEDLKAVANKVAQTLSGGNLSPEDLDKFVNAYHGMEAGSQQAAYGAGESGGAYTAPPDPTVAATNQIKTDHPLEVGQQGFVNQFQDLLSTFTQRKPGGGA